MPAVTLGSASLLMLIVVCAVLPGAATTGTPAGSDNGQTPTADVRPHEPLTLERALELAEQYSPRLRAANAQTEGARAGIVSARAYPNPDLTLIGGNQRARLTGAVPGAVQIYSFAQPLELPAVRRSRIQGAEYGRESSEFAVAEARLDVRAQVKQAFYEVLRRKGEVELARENLKRIEDLQRRIAVQVQVGEAARLELTRANAEVATARTMVRGAQLQLVSSISGLRAAISAPLDVNLEPEGQLDPPQILPPLDALRNDVLGRHPTLAQAKAEISRAQARLANEEALRMPQPVLRTEYERQPDLGYIRVGVYFPLPLWNRRKGEIGQAVAAVRQASATADQRRLEITAELERAYGQYQIASQQVAAFEQGILLGAEAALRAAEAAYRFGERGIIEVLDAQRVLRGARMDFLNAQFDRQAALIELERLRAVDPVQKP